MQPLSYKQLHKWFLLMTESFLVIKCPQSSEGHYFNSSLDRQSVWLCMIHLFAHGTNTKCDWTSLLGGAWMMCIYSRRICNHCCWGQDGTVLQKGDFWTWRWLLLACCCWRSSAAVWPASRLGTAAAFLHLQWLNMKAQLSLKWEIHTWFSWKVLSFVSIKPELARRYSYLFIRCL